MRFFPTRALFLAAAVAVPASSGLDDTRPPEEQLCLAPPAPAPTAPAVVDRRALLDLRGHAASRRADGLRRLMRHLGARGGALEEACVEPEAGPSASSGCARPALAHFFRALDGAALEQRRAGVVFFGNSLIASDGITRVVRRQLAERFDDGGRGFLLADRMAEYGPRDRTAQRAWGWRPETTADGARASTALALAGVQHVSDGPAFSRFALEGATRAQIFWRAPPRARLAVRVDSGPWTPLTAGDRGPQRTELPLAFGARHLDLRAAGPGAVVQGVALDNGPGGVVVDVFGVPSADANLWLDTDEALFSEQLAARDPDLLVVMLGGNETKRIAWGNTTRSTAEDELRRFVSRTRAATPNASCLVVGPIDSVVGGPSPGRVAPPPDPFRERPQLSGVIALEREVALEQGCAFFDLYAAMGGRGSVERLHEAGQMHDDLTHPRQKGLDLLGQLLTDALLDAYEESSPAEPEAPAPRPMAGRQVTSRGP